MSDAEVGVTEKLPAKKKRKRKAIPPKRERVEVKPGKIVRIDPTLLDFLEKQRRMKEPLSRTIRRLLGLNTARFTADVSAEPREFYILADSRIVCASRTLAEARGEAVFYRGTRASIEEPLLVREIIK